MSLKVHQALAALLLAVFTFGYAANLRAEQDIPVPATKPEVIVKAESLTPERKPEPLGPPKPELQPKTQQEEIAEADTEDTTILDDVIGFTASLLDFSGPPVPKRKPEFIPREPSVIEKLIKKAKTPMAEKPLSDNDIEIYKSVFDLQKQGEFKKADKRLKDLDDPRLMGHVLLERYMHPKSYRAKFSELRTWLNLFNDHPGANRIYALAEKRKPAGFSGTLKSPTKARGVVRKSEPTMRLGKRYVSSKTRSNEEVRTLNSFNRSIFNLVRKGQPTNALTTLKSRGDLLDQVEYDLLLAQIAAGYLYEGEAEKAFALASQSVQRSGLHVPKAGWVAGLVSWSNKDYQKAARYFEVVARSPYASGWTVAAGSYWAARAHMRTGNVKAVSIWLKRAVNYPRTFYGLIATRALGRDFDFNWKVPPFTKDYLETLQTIPAANRAMALVMTGRSDLAEAELIRIQPKDDTQYKALLAYAGYANLPGLALRLGSAASSDQGTFYDAALYPTGDWEPEEGYKIDPALVHAIMRQESRFDPRAKSPSGAKGLMQLMPATAKSVADKGQTELDNPETNLELGQRYLDNLLGSTHVNGDLLYLLIAYNAGPGNLSKWKNRWSNVEDPLLFIELVPSSETRTYVERVLANYWIYRLREGADTPSLDALASGKSAIYSSTAL